MRLSHDQGPARFPSGPNEIAIKRGGAAILNSPERATLLDVIESASAIRRAEELHRWSKGDLQRILPHKLFVCGVAEVSNQQLALKPFLLVGMPASSRQKETIAASVNLLASVLARSAKDPVPQLVAVENGSLDSSDDVRRFLGHIAAHGVLFDTTGSGSFVAACQMLEQPETKHALALKLLAPHLHIVIKGMCARKNVGSSDENSRVRLSARETEVLRWLGKGMKASEVAQILDRSPHTVKNQMRNIYSKLNASNKTQALYRASELALLD